MLEVESCSQLSASFLTLVSSLCRLYELAQTPAAHDVLDVGIYKNRNWNVKVPLVGGVGIQSVDGWGSAECF